MNNKEVFGSENGKKYDWIGKFVNGFAIVELDGRYGFINEEFEEIVSPKYGLAYDFQNGFARVEYNGKWGFINKEGKEIAPLKYDFAEDFYEGLAEVRVETFSAATCYYPILYYGYVDENGNQVVPVEYNRVAHEYGTLTLSKYDEHGKIQLESILVKDLLSK